MANSIYFADRVKDTTTTTGTGNITLAGSPPTGFQSFNSAYGTTKYFQYCITAGAEWEVGEGHLSASTTLVRDTVFASSNSNAAVSFSAGTKDVFSTISGDRAQHTWKSVIKTSDQSKASDTTLAADSALVLAMLPATRYLLRAQIFGTCNTNPGVKWRYTVTSAASQACFVTHWWLDNAATGITGAKSNTGDTPSTVTGAATGGFFSIFLEGWVLTHATNASNFNFEWAQASSSANATQIYAGSRIEYLIV